jgi:uncharacterized protein YhaN
VIIQRSHILGFGKLCDTRIDFRDGLNLIFAPNEGGKSTLQRFLIGLLYGQLRSDLRVQRRLDPWVEQYKPWRGAEYGGILWCRLADGRDLEIHRSFGREEARIEIRSSAGEDVTSQYEQQRNGDVLFARFHFGMPKDLFESVGVIRENRVAEIDGQETIRDRIANLAHSGDEDLSIRQSLSSLRDKLDSIGSDRAPKRPYRQAMDALEALRSEQKAADERRVQFQTWIEDRNRLAGEISVLEDEEAEIQATLLSARRREVETRVRSLEEIENALRSIGAEIDALGARSDFPAGRLEELNRLVGARDSISKHLSEVRPDKEAALAQLVQAESEREKLAAYAAFSSGSDAERITEWFVSYLNISLQKDGVQKTIRRLRAEAAALKEKIGGLGSAFMDPNTDWEHMAREAAEDEQSASRNCESLSERIMQQKSIVASRRGAALRWRIPAIASLLLAALPPAMRFWGGFDRFPILYDIGIVSLLGITAIVMFHFGSKSAEAGSSAKQTLQNLENELKRVRDEGQIRRVKLNEVIAGSGFEGLDDFLTAAKQSERDRNKLADLQTRLAEAEQQNAQLQAQSDDIYRLLKDSLGRVGLFCSPGNLKFQIDVLRSNLRKFREIDARYSSCLEKAESLKSKDSALVNDRDDSLRKIQSLLNEAGVETPEDFRTECSKRQKLLELKEREASLTREFNRLAGDQTLEQWRDRLQELVEQPVPERTETESPVGSRSENLQSSAQYLPYLPTIAEAEERHKRIAATLSHAREEYARSVERIRHAFQSIRSSSEIDEDLAIAEKRFQELERNKVALETALEVLEKLSRQQQEVLAPQLNSAVEQRFLRLCGNRYEEVKIDPDFQVWVRELDSGELRPAENLSRGTQDQLYFAIRFGVLDLISNQEEPCPGFLDEPFAAYDRSRLGEAFEVLSEESGRRQILLFTCREDLFDLAQKCGAHVVRLENSA